MGLGCHQRETAAALLACNTEPASLPPVLGSLLGFCLLQVREAGVGRKGATSSLRFWAHKQLALVSHSFEVLGLFVEAEDHSSALDKLIVSIKDSNDCHMQIRVRKS